MDLRQQTVLFQYLLLAFFVVVVWSMLQLLKALWKSFFSKKRKAKRGSSTPSETDHQDENGYIFLSYSRGDDNAISEFSAVLSGCGISYWIDKNGLSVEPSWAASIVNAIRHSRATLVFCSGNAYRSENVARELNLSSHFGKPIIPVILDDAEPSDPFLYFIAMPNQLRLTQGSIRSRRKELEEYLRTTPLID